MTEPPRIVWDREKFWRGFKQWKIRNRTAMQARDEEKRRQRAETRRQERVRPCRCPS
jgi:hypothetical protein